MVPSMSRPANPYDNASCESFIKTLKREEIYTNKYEDLEHLRTNIEEFIEEYYNRQRLHSALGYRSPSSRRGPQQRRTARSPPGTECSEWSSWVGPHSRFNSLA
jgi:putative transposase